MTMRQQAMNGNRKSAQGFTLIELMIVVVIIGIIAAYAIPNYRDYQTNSRRSEAKTLLMDIAARQEQYFLDNRSYTNDLSKLNYTLTAGKVRTTNGYYDISVSAFTTTTFTLTAAPLSAQVGDSCGNLTLTEAGVRGNAAGGVKCW